MSGRPTRQTLYDPLNDTEAIRISALNVGMHPVDPKRNNYFGIYWVAAGGGEYCADTGRYPFMAGSLLFCTPYQRVRISPTDALQISLIQFHANFLCVETFHAESGCAGALFNDPYQPPVVLLDAKTRRDVTKLVEQMLREQDVRALAFEEMLLAHLKILLITATRAKGRRADASAGGGKKPRHPVLGPLKKLIEEEYHRLHTPSDYAKLLHMTPRTLGRIVREQLGKSLSNLIRERILTHAKWQLLHTLTPVKEIAREVGYGDELYFSRVFKKSTGYSPTFFREFETKIRGGSNLSMLSPPPSILTRRRSVDTSGS